MANMKLLRLFLLLFIFSCNTSEKKPDTRRSLKEIANQVKPTAFDTLPNGKRLLDTRDSVMHLYYKEIVGSDTLKGGYITCYGIDDSMRYFYLRHGDTLHLLNKNDVLVSPWSLGTLAEDYDSFFITVINNGNSTPQSYQVFDKKTGKNILGDGVIATDYMHSVDGLYFLCDNVYNKWDFGNNKKDGDSVFLYSMKSDKRKGFKTPPSKPDEIVHFSIDTVTRNSLTIILTEYYSGDEKAIKFNR